MIEWLKTGIDYVMNQFSGLMSKMIIAVLILLIGFIVGRVVERLMHRILHELEMDRILKETARIKFSMERMISRFISYFIYFLTIIIALNQLGLTTTVLHMIAAAVLIIIVLSIILAVKDFIPNMLAGAHISKKHIISEGDVINVMGTEGKVIDIDLNETKIETKSGDILYIPNSALVKEKIIKVKQKKSKAKKSKK